MVKMPELLLGIGLMVLLALFVGGCLYMGLRYLKHLAEIAKAGYQFGKSKDNEVPKRTETKPQS